MGRYNRDTSQGASGSDQGVEMKEQVEEVIRSPSPATSQPQPSSAVDYLVAQALAGRARAAVRESVPSVASLVARAEEGRAQAAVRANLPSVASLVAQSQASRAQAALRDQVSSQQNLAEEDRLDWEAIEGRKRKEKEKEKEGREARVLSDIEPQDAALAQAHDSKDRRPE